MKAAKFQSRWERRFHRMLRRADKLRRKCLRHGKATDIHALRVVLRRLRLFASIGGPCLDSKSSRKFKMWSRGVSDALGPARDLDVTSEWLARSPGMEDQQRELAARRAGMWLRARSQLVPLPRHLESVLRQRRDDTKSAGFRLRRFKRIKAGVATTLLADLPVLLSLSPRNQHAFRRRIRRLRFLREIELPLREHRKDSLLALLVELHEALGERQNARVIGQWLRRRHFPGKTRLLAKLRRQVEEAEPGLRAGLQRLLPYLEKTGD